MALKFRRGSTAQQSGSLAFGEPYVNTTLGTLIVGGASGDIVLAAGGTGSTGNFGPISGSGLDITGNANIAGNLTLGGNITIGDTNIDNLVINADLSSSLIPNNDNAFTIGTPSLRYSNIYGTNIVGAIQATNGVVSGSSQITYASISSIPAGIVSGAAQVTPLLPTGTVSGSSQITYASISSIPSGIVSGAAQVTPLLPTGVVSGSAQVTLGSTTGFSTYNTAISTITGSLISSASVAKSTNDTQDGRLTSLETTSASVNASIASLNAYTSSNTSTTALNAFTASANTKFTEIGVVSGSLISSASADRISITNINTLTASALTRLTALEVKTSNLETFSGSQLGKDATLATYTGSNDTKWSTLGSLSGSFARTNSANTFNGTQTVSGSLFVTQDLVVAGSSSIQNISSSNLVIGAAYVTLNTNTPSSRYAGLNIIDSGSNGGSGSLWYDAVQDEFIQVHKGNGLNVTSSHFVQGPQTYDNLGNELYLTNNRLTKGTGVEHIVDSQITDDGTTVSIPGALTVTGNITGPIRATNGVVSGSSQITYASISSIPAGIVSGAAQVTPLLPTGVVSGSSQITYASISSIPAGIVSGAAQVTPLLPTGTVSGSVQVLGGTGIHSGSITNYLPTGTVSGSSQIVGSSITTNTVTVGSTAIALGGTATTIAGLTSVSSTGFTGALTGNASTATTLATARNINGTSFNGSADITIPNLVSGSSQISAGSTTGFATDVKTQLNANTVISGSSQVVGSSITTNTITINGVSTALGGSNTITAANPNALTIGTGLSGTSYTGGSAVTIANTGVLSITSNTGLSANASATGNVTITNTGVTSVVAGTGVSVSGATGAVTISIGQAVATTSTPTFGNLTINGTITATGDITAYFTSDRRHKNNIQTISNAVLKVKQLNGVTWEWNDDVNEVTKSTPKTGLIAQEVQLVLPQVVTERENGFLALDYSKMVGLLVEAIKEQQIQIDQLKAQIGSK